MNIDDKKNASLSISVDQIRFKGTKNHRSDGRGR